jgi:hypothetical protein
VTGKSRSSGTCILGFQNVCATGSEGGGAGSGRRFMYEKLDPVKVKPEDVCSLCDNLIENV